MSTGDTIRALRKRAGLSQDQLAAELGWSRSTLTNIERGHDQPGRELVEALATFFGVSTDQIIDRKGTPQPAQAQSEDEAELLTLYREAKGDMREAVRSMLRAALKAAN